MHNVTTPAYLQVSSESGVSLDDNLYAHHMRIIRRYCLQIERKYMERYIYLPNIRSDTSTPQFKPATTQIITNPSYVYTIV